MPQLSLYVTNEQFSKIKNAASLSKMSISKWVAKKIMEKEEERYPLGWEDLFGSVTDSTFSRPEQPFLKKMESL